MVEQPIEGPFPLLRREPPVEELLQEFGRLVGALMRIGRDVGAAFPVGLQTFRGMALKPFDCRLGPQPPQGKMHFVHVKDPAGDGGP